MQNRKSFLTGSNGELILKLAMVGMSMIFLSLIIFMFLQESSKDARHWALPKILWLNSIILFVSDGLLRKGRRQLEKEQIKATLWTLGSVLLLSLLFLFGQALAFLKMDFSHPQSVWNPVASYLVLLASVHALHVIAAILALVYFMGKMMRWRNDPVKKLVHLNQPPLKAAFENLNLFFRFLNGLWILLFLSLLFLVT